MSDNVRLKLPSPSPRPQHHVDDRVRRSAGVLQEQERLPVRRDREDEGVLRRAKELGGVGVGVAPVVGGIGHDAHHAALSER
jgi:hypothetical protein